MNLQENISLKKYNTFGIEARARYFSAFSSTIELAELLTRAGGGPVMILGGGSNILLTADVNGFVFKNEIPGITVTGQDADFVYVKAGAGENWHGFVQHCVAQNLGGVENLSLIPGCTGAAPMQNIGAYGVEIKDVFHELEAWDTEDKKTVLFTLSGCGFGYRESVFKRLYKNRFVILNVTFRLRKQPVFNTSYGAIEQELAAMGVQQLSAAAISRAVINIRQSKLPDPAVIGNAGSFFKNPEISAVQFEHLRQQYPAVVGYPLPGEKVKLAAGWLIEQCGFKGLRRGDAGCHAKQALVLVNYGNATGKEIFDLSTEILEAVQHKFGVLLEREVNVV